MSLSTTLSNAVPSLTADTISIGKSFSSARDLRVAAERVLLSQGRTLVSDFRVNGGRQKVYRCSAAVMTKGVKGIAGGCPVFVRAYKRADDHFYVTDFLLEHRDCAGGKKKPSLRAMAAEGAVVVNANRKITSGGLVKTLKGAYGVELKQHTANRLKRSIVGVGEAELNEGYRRLHSYLDLLAKESPGTITDCQWDDDGHFVRAFVMLGSVAHFATQGVQQVACTDFAHLKGEFNGTMGTISTKNSNNNVVHVATCIVAKETGDSYRYMINNALRHPAMANFLTKPSTTIITDKHKGSDSAIPELLGEAEHLRCVEHLLKGHGTVGPEGRMHMYLAARAPNEATCKEHLDKIKAMNATAGHKIASTPHHTWAMYATRGNVVWDQVTSNMSETTNHLIGPETRAKPAIDLIQDVVMQSSARLAAAAELGGPADTFCPFAMTTFNAELEWANTCDVSPTGGGGYMVFRNNNLRHYNVVKLSFAENPADHTYSCTCGWCSRWCMPCRHVLAVIKANGDNHRAFELLHKGFRLSNLRAAASDPQYHVVPPVWTSLDADPNHKAPLRVDGQAGRRKGVRTTKRRRSNGEYATSSRSYALHVANANSGPLTAPPPSQGQSQSLSQSLSQGQSQSLSQGQSQGLSQGQSQGLSQGTLVVD